MLGQRIAMRYRMTMGLVARFFFAASHNQSHEISVENISNFKENTTTWHFAIERRLLVNMHFLAKITCMLELCQLI